MEAIGIIIFIVFMLLRVFSKLPEIKQKLPRGWEQEFPPIFRDIGFPWGEQNMPGQVEDRPTPVRNTGPTYELAAETQQPARVWALSQDIEHQESEAPRETVIDSPAADAFTLQSEQGLLLDEQAVLNGIIFSEILSPPKSKRLIFRRR